jgi:hypothetical protein
VFFARFPSRIRFPRKSGRVGLGIGFFQVCSAFSHVTACEVGMLFIDFEQRQRMRSRNQPKTVSSPKYLADFRGQ